MLLGRRIFKSALCFYDKTLAKTNVEKERVYLSLLSSQSPLLKSVRSENIRQELGGRNQEGRLYSSSHSGSCSATLSYTTRSTIPGMVSPTWTGPCFLNHQSRQCIDII